MNEHLYKVFSIILPEFEKQQIFYWVFGGVSIAAHEGLFIRYNKDVDVFVRDVDFKKAKVMLSDLCEENKLKIKSNLQKNNGRPKVEIEIDAIERFSMIPVYQCGSMVMFKYKDGDQKYSNEILKRVERNISGYKFFTSRSEFIKEMFTNHIKARIDKKNRNKIKIDARAILNSEELASLEIES